MSFERISRIPIDQDRSNASQQSRELSKGESSRSRELRTAYNLRPRNVHPNTLEKRSKLEERRMQQKQRRKLLAEESASRIRNEIQMMIDRMPKRRPNDDKENDHKTEVFNAGESALWNVWHPYDHTPDIGYSCTLKEASWEVEMLVLQIAPSVVALQSLTGETQLFSCSGTIVEVSKGNGFVVTVANLVKRPDADELAENLKMLFACQIRLRTGTRMNKRSRSHWNNGMKLWDVKMLC